MSLALQYYISTLLVYLDVAALACMGLNLQFGVAGLLSFAFILFQAAGAYTAAVLTLGPQSTNGAFQQYIVGLHLQFPIPWLAAAAVGAVLGVPFALVGLRRIRSDYQAVTMLVISLVATTIISNATPLFNGSRGLALVPQPLADQVSLAPSQYSWAYGAATAALCLGCFVILKRLYNAPFGRVLRAVRENELAALALGKNVLGLRIVAYCLGGVMGAVSGAALVQFIGTWAPSGWLYPETFVYFAAVIIGGRGSNIGPIVGALLVPVAFTEATRYLPPFGWPGMIGAVQYIAIGILIIAFIAFRPQGIFPERRKIEPTKRPPEHGLWAFLTHRAMTSGERSPRG